MGEVHVEVHAKIAATWPATLGKSKMTELDRQFVGEA
jgi:hypothetical protein